MFRTVPLSIIRSFFIVHTAMVYVIQVCCVYSEKTPEDGQRNSPKHVEFCSKNQFDKLVHLFGFIIRMCYRAWTKLGARYLHAVLFMNSTKIGEGKAVLYLVDVNGVTGASVSYSFVPFERQITFVQSVLRHTVRHVAVLLYTINCYVIFC